MTVRKQKKQTALPVRADRILLIFVSVLLIGIFIKNASAAAEYVSQALLLCVRTVIPSIFPSTVLSSVFISLGGGSLLGGLFERPMRFLFGVSGSGATVLLLGWFCGFPVAAISGASLVRRGELEENELSRLMLFSNIPSPAFVISAVGDSMLGNHAAGVALYLTLLSVAIITGILLRVFSKSSPTVSNSQKPIESSLGISEALASCAVSMLNLCANIVFFSVLTKLILPLLGGIFAISEISALICGIFELSGGCAEAAALGGRSAVAICGFILGWSGIGVHFQIISAFTRLKNLPLYITVKLLWGLVCAAVMLILPLTV